MIVGNISTDIEKGDISDKKLLILGTSKFDNHLEGFEKQIILTYQKKFTLEVES